MSADRPITIEIALPPKALHPNTARVHFHAKRRAVKGYRLATWAAATIALRLAQRDAPRWKFASERATFFFKRNGRRDADNLLASLKAAFDGLRDAGVIEDDSGLSHEPVQVVVDRKHPRVRIEVRKIERSLT